MAPCAAAAGSAEVSGDRTLRIERTFNAQAEAVFDAWTSEVMRRWWHVGRDWATAEAQVDLRVGGAVRVVMRDRTTAPSTAAAARTGSTRRPGSRSRGCGTARHTGR
jgi:uncharacterized protein YndB with AHSA1/START domain